jgi:CheY-like chemotaxis protein
MTFPPPDLAAARQRRSPHLLVIEDRPDQQAIISHVLHAVIPNVWPIWVSDASQTLQYLNHCQTEGDKLPTLALLDLYLPQREQGWALLQELKTTGFMAKIPVVILSHSDDPVDIKTCYELGATSYITKPHTAAEWANYFGSLQNYWFKSVTTPSKRYGL